MARDRKKLPEPTAKDQAFSQFAAIFGKVPQYTVADWDVEAADFLQAILEIAGGGNCVFIRPGTGKQSLGIAVWEGDIRNPAVWLHEEGEVDQWSKAILGVTGDTRKKSRYGEAAD